jgi:hypothetical protein
MPERAGAILMEKRELGCSCHTPVLISNWGRSGTGGPSSQGVLRSERWKLLFGEARIQEECAPDELRSQSKRKAYPLGSARRLFLLLILIVFDVIVFIVDIDLCLLLGRCGHQSCCGAAA